MNDKDTEIARKIFEYTVTDPWFEDRLAQLAEGKNPPGMQMAYICREEREGEDKPIQIFSTSVMHAILKHQRTVQKRKRTILIKRHPHVLPEVEAMIDAHNAEQNKVV